MATNRKKYCYVIVDKDTAKLKLRSAELPFFWNRKVAKQICANYKNHVVHKINLSDIEKLILKSDKA